MGHTFSQLLTHVVFSAKDRRPSIRPQWREDLYAYMVGVAKGEFGRALRVGGTANHAHALLAIRPDVSVAHAMNRFKSLSSRWVHVTHPAERTFAWQSGYSAFSVSRSRSSAVIAYIREQEAHHRNRTFEEELRELLKRHGVAYDPKRFLD